MTISTGTKHWVWFEGDVGGGPMELDGSELVTYDGREVALFAVPMGASVLAFSIYGTPMKGVVGEAPSSVVFRVEVWKDGVKPLEMQEAVQEAIDSTNFRCMGVKKVTVKIEYCFVPLGPRPVVPSEPV